MEASKEDINSYLEEGVIMAIYYGRCDTCKYCWQDYSVNASECECEDITEEEIDKYFCDGNDGCPHYEEEEDEQF